MASVAIAGTLVMSSCSKSPPESSPPPVAPPITNASPAAGATEVTNALSEKVLNGRWQRPDGGYVIEVAGVQADGKLEAYYFNPRPIHVSRAEWRRENGGIHVFVELRDQNYPGATYKLRYRPEQDQLAGDYHQPLHQQTFDVYFIRQPR